MIATTIGIIGISGSGKTFFASRLLQNEKRVVIFDPTSDAAFDCYFPIDNVMDLVHGMSKAEFQIVFRPEDFADFDLAFKALLYFKHYVLLIDEISLFCNSYNIPDVLKTLSYLRRRRNDLCFMWTSQRPKIVHLDITSQTHNIISFYLDDASSLSFLPDIWRKSGELSGLKIAEYDGAGEYRIVKGRPDLLQRCFPSYQFTL